jgi:two-component system CheB/CheR fusion protein
MNLSAWLSVRNFDVAGTVRKVMDTAGRGNAEALVEENRPLVDHSVSESTTATSELIVVALGASAGGLEALEKFFDNLPSDNGLAFVVVQHLSPDFKSLMDELLARHTKLTIHRVTDGMSLEPNSIYLIPPKKEMIVSGGKLLLTDKDPSQGLSLPIDTFLRSLATDCGERAIAVILSGTGSDGSRGIRAIHEAGGFVIVQDEASANFDGMPRSAIDTGVVDAVLPPSKMGAAVLNRARGIPHEPADGQGGGVDETAIESIFRALRDAYAIDFSLYKPNTVARRVERRLQMNGAVDLDHYVARLREDREELNSLYRDLLIGVTQFFRDEKAFRLMETEILPQLLSRVAPNEDLRVWIAGCATGEEAYSIGILVHEAFANRQRPVNAKIFATDVHQASLDFASAGFYSQESLQGMSDERKARFFVPHPGGYQVSAELRKTIVFAPHNVVKDAPFTKLDLVCCRNLLIYFQPAAQKKAISLFHFALKASGIMFLGPSETAGELADEFETIDGHWKIFRKRRDVRLPSDLRLPLSSGLPRFRAVAGAGTTLDVRGLPDAQLMRAYDALLTKYVPPSLLVNERRELVHSFSGAGRFLSHPDGRPSQDVLELVQKDLKLPLAGALQRAAKERDSVKYGRLPMASLPEGEQLMLSVSPVTIPSSGETFFLVSFEAEFKKPSPVEQDGKFDFDDASRERLADVEDELRYAKENLQATIEELETTNEELQATNEELVASNEELQSTNEELHSVNEELYTVNAEHQRKITELTELTDDMDNLLRSTDIGTIFLDRQLRIRKFTPQIYQIFQIMPQDVGRSIEAFSPTIRHDTLVRDVQQVAETGMPFEKDVRDRRGKWFLLRILPYRSRGQIDGVVITLIDVEGLKQTEAELRRMSKVFMDAADPILIEDLSGRIIEANREAVDAYGGTREELIGANINILIPPEEQAEVTALRQRCRNAEHVRNVEGLRRDKAGRLHPILTTLSLLSDEEGKPIGIANISKDIERQKNAERAALESVVRRDEFLAMLSHELRNPLGAVLNASQLLSHSDAGADDSATLAADVILRQGRQMARLLDDLLDVSRVTQGKIDIRKEVIDVSELVEVAIEAVRPVISGRDHELVVDVCDEPLYVEGDSARLLQIQENLLTNAAKYTPRGGRISVTVARENNAAVICVQDNGQGIESDMLEQIFELFVQEKKSLARTEGGMGIGLSLVKLLVELHQGSVSVESDGRGKGSRFAVRLPLTHKRPPAPAVGNLPKAANVRVLIVEDNPDSRSTLEHLLRFDGYVVASAADGIAGYDAIRRDPPDVALVDIGLPGLNGYEIARRVRQEFSNRPIRLVALTGYGRAEDHESVIEAGFDEHLIKPVSREELLRVLQESDGK